MSSKNSAIAGVQRLVEKWRALDDEELIYSVLNDGPAMDVAVVTSFGTESAVLLDLVARIDRTVPVIFVNTGQLFPETLSYRDRLIDRLGLTDVRTVAEEEVRISQVDPDGVLYRTDSDACCNLRKVAPYARALAAFDIEITGRKRFQGNNRIDLETVEQVGHRLKLNPLAHWSPAMIDSAYEQRGLPRHPLSFDGYDSVGCAVCTHRNRLGEPARAGRWAGRDKTECGIHFAFSDTSLIPSSP